MAASLLFSTGRTSFLPVFLASTAPESAPLAVLIPPSRESSPSMRYSSRFSAVTMPSAFKMPIATGRSNVVPSFFISAGGRVMVYFFGWKVVAGIFYGRPAPVLALFYGIVRQSHSGKRGQAPGDVNLHLYLK